MRPLPSFKDAILSTEEDDNYLLLGNGFSIAVHPEFRYKSLLAIATYGGSLNERIVRIFDKYSTTDFEEILRKLDDAGWLVSQYDGNNDQLRDDIKKDRRAVRSGLVNAISVCHPPFPKAIGDKKLQRAGAFMSQFSAILTTNYDLLSYWSFLAGCASLGFSDGFNRDEDGGLSYLDPPRGQEQRILYLHGGLHLYSEGYKVKKRWVRDAAIIDQVSEALKRRQYPLFVSEGIWQRKKEKIQSNIYLSDCWDYFCNITGNLFIYASSLTFDSDGHLWDSISLNCGIEHLFIAIRGDPLSERNEGLANRARKITSAREALRKSGKVSSDETACPKLKLTFFDADSANVWG